MAVEGTRSTRKARNDDEHGCRCPCKTGRDDGPADNKSPAAQGVPKPQPTEEQTHLLLTRRSENSKQGEPRELLLIEIPDREENERNRHDRWVELVQRPPFQSRVEEVNHRELQRGTLRRQVLAGEPEDRKCAECESNGLAGKQHLRARPDPP